MHHVLLVCADAAKNPEHRLNEEGRLDELPVDEVSERVEVSDVVALDLEPGAVVGAAFEDVLDVGEGVLEDAVAGAFEIGPFPLVFEVLGALQRPRALARSQAAAAPRPSSSPRRPSSD
jgi:hypothetical protein